MKPKTHDRVVDCHDKARGILDTKHATKPMIDHADAWVRLANSIAFHEE